jgi:hypothetical protein
MNDSFRSAGPSDNVIASCPPRVASTESLLERELCRNDESCVNSPRNVVSPWPCLMPMKLTSTPACVSHSNDWHKGLTTFLMMVIRIHTPIALHNYVDRVGYDASQSNLYSQPCDIKMTVWAIAVVRHPSCHSMHCNARGAQHCG